MKKLLVGILVGSVVLGGLTGCFSFGRGHGPVDAFQFLTSRNPSLDQNVTGVMNERADPAEILVVIPPTAGSLNLVATFSLNTEAVISVVSSGRPVVQQNGVTRNDFSSPVLYSLQVPGDKNPWRYRVSVRYAETNAALSQISIPEGYAMSPLFSPRVKSYTVEVPYTVKKVRIDAKGQSQTLKDIAIDGAGSGGPSASTTVDFSSGYSRTVFIETLAEDGVTRDEYTVVLKRLPADSNAKLESLEVVDTALFPAFSPTRTAYRAELPFDTTQVVVKAKAQSKYATITLQTLAVAGRITSSRTALASRGSPTDRAGAVIDFSSGTLLPVIVAVTAEDGGVQEYLVEIVRTEPDHNNALAELEVAGGRMTPAFSPRTLRYAVEVPYSTQQLFITARTQSAYATMELVPGSVSITMPTPALQARGDLAGKGGVTVEFPTAERIILGVAVTAQDGKTVQYVLDVRRAPPDSNADLGALTASAGVLSPIFSPRIISYAVSLPSSIDSVRLTASTASTVATVAVEGTTSRPAASQTFTVSVAAGAIETVNLMVTAEDGTQKMYRVRVSREATGPGGPGDRNARLARLQLAGAQLNPSFDPRVLEYQAQLASNVNSVVLTATPESTTATIEVDGQLLSRTGRVITLEPGASKTVIIDVTAESGNVARTIIWLSRESARDTNTRLSRLQLAGAQLNPTFDPRILEYQAQLPLNVNSVTLTATAESPTATIEVDGQLLSRTGRVIILDPRGTKSVIIDVTAASGNVARTIIWLGREAARDTNARLSRLQLVGAQLNPNFDSRVFEYQAELASNVNAVTLIALAESPTATIEVDGQLLSRTGRVITLDPRGTKTVIIDVTAEAGNVARTIVRLSREAARDTNARLARLQLAGAQLNPSFDPRLLEYQAQLPSNVNAVTLTATAESPTATIEVDGQLLSRTGRVIALEPGTSQTVLIDVTAESGNVARTVIRLSRESARDTNTRLSRLQLAGAALRPNFDPRVLEYQAQLASNVASVVLTAAAESPAATIEIDGQPMTRTGRVIEVDPGASRTVLVDVTAEAGNVARTIVRLNRQPGGQPGGPGGPGTPGGPGGPGEPGGPGGPGGPSGPIVNPGSSRISVTLDGVKTARREQPSIVDNRGSIGDEARITARYYRTNTVIAQGTTKVDVKMQGAMMVLTASWSSSAVRLDQGKLVEVEVAIQAGGANWLHYTEAQWPSPAVAIDVPFLLSSRDPRVAWPAVGKAVSVAGYIPFSPEGSRKSESPAESDNLELNTKGEYGVEVTIIDPASGRILGTDTVWAKPGIVRSPILAFSRPMSLPEGATVKYTLTARARNGKGWAASGTTQVWTTSLTADGGFEPVILRFGEYLAPQR